MQQIGSGLVKQRGAVVLVEVDHLNHVDQMFAFEVAASEQVVQCVVPAVVFCVQVNSVLEKQPENGAKLAAVAVSTAQNVECRFSCFSEKQN